MKELFRPLIVSRPDGSAICDVNMRLPSRANLRMMPLQASKFVKRQRKQVAIGLLFLRTYRPKLPCVVTLTRREVVNIRDDDNLHHAFKSVRDEIAHWLGIDDSDDRVTWVYKQDRCDTPHIRISFDPAS